METFSLMLLIVITVLIYLIALVAILLATGKISLEKPDEFGSGNCGTEESEGERK